MGLRLLYITWDGPEQRYLESLYLPLFESLLAHDIRTRVLQFRWGDDGGRLDAARAAAARGIEYEARSVARAHVVAGTVATLTKGVIDVARVVRAHEPDVVMPRSILPGAMALGAQRLAPRPLVFDADGLMADERVEFGGWSRDGLPYRALRQIEARLVRRADAVLTRTDSARSILFDRAGKRAEPSKLHVVPNARDEDLCHPGDERARGAAREEFGIAPTAPLIVYSGTLGPQYMPARIFRFLRQCQRRRPETRLLVLTGNEDIAEAAAREVGVDSSTLRILRAAPERVPFYLAAADVGLAFRMPSFSQQAVCPIKVGEYLLCGLPILYTSGIGDLDSRLGPHIRLARADGSGSLADAAAWFVDEVLPHRQTLRAEARALGLEEYSLGEVGERLAGVLHQVHQRRS